MTDSIAAVHAGAGRGFNIGAVRGGVGLGSGMVGSFSGGIWDGLWKTRHISRAVDPGAGCQRRSCMFAAISLTSASRWLTWFAKTVASGGGSILSSLNSEPRGQRKPEASSVEHEPFTARPINPVETLALRTRAAHTCTSVRSGIARFGRDRGHQARRVRV